MPNVYFNSSTLTAVISQLLSALSTISEEVNRKPCTSESGMWRLLWWSSVYYLFREECYLRWSYIFANIHGLWAFKPDLNQYCPGSSNVPIYRFKVCTTEGFHVSKIWLAKRIRQGFKLKSVIGDLVTVDSALKRLRCMNFRDLTYVVINFRKFIAVFQI